MQNICECDHHQKVLLTLKKKYQVCTFLPKAFKNYFFTFQMDTKILHSVNVIIIRRTIFPSYFENFLTRAFIQIYFLLTRWTQKSSILCKISVNVIIIRRTIFPSTPIIMCESVSVFLSCKSK